MADPVPVGATRATGPEPVSIQLGREGREATGASGATFRSRMPILGPAQRQEHVSLIRVIFDAIPQVFNLFRVS